MALFPDNKTELWALLKLLIQRKDWERAVPYFQKGVLDCIDQNNDLVATYSLTILARALGERGKDDASQLCLRVALTAARKLESPLLETFVLIQMGWVHLCFARSDKARIRGQKSQMVLKEVKEYSDLLFTLKQEALEILMIACDSLGEKRAYEKYRQDMEELFTQYIPPDYSELLTKNPLDQWEGADPLSFEEFEKKIEKWEEGIGESPYSRKKDTGEEKKEALRIALKEEERKEAQKAQEAKKNPPSSQDPTPAQAPSEKEPPSEEPQAKGPSSEEEIPLELAETHTAQREKLFSPANSESIVELAETKTGKKGDIPSSEEELERSLKQEVGVSKEEDPPEEKEELSPQEEEEALQDTLGHIRSNRLTMAMKALPSFKKQAEEEEETGSNLEESAGEGEGRSREKTSIKERIHLAEENLSKGFFGQAKKLAEEILRDSPEHERAKKIIHLAAELRIVMERMLSRAFKLEEESRLPEALREWEKILDMAPNHPKVMQNIESLKLRLSQGLEKRLEELMELYNQGKFRVVLAKGQELLKIDSQNTEGLQIIEQVKENLKEGENLLLKAQRAFHDGDLNNARIFAGRVLELDPQKEEAKKILQEIQGPSPIDSEIERKKRDQANRLIGSAQELLDMELLEEAYQITRVALSLDPGRSDAQDIIKIITLEHPQIAEKGEKREVLEPSQSPSPSDSKTTPAGSSKTSSGEAPREEKIVADLELQEEEFTKVLQKRKATRIFPKMEMTKGISALPPANPVSSSPPRPGTASTKNRKKLLAFFEETMEEEEEKGN